MRALVQRVTSAEVSVGAETMGRIGVGLCVLVGATHGDTVATAERLGERIWGLRIFEDGAGLTNLAGAAVGGEVLVVSQFTLYADTGRGRRPSFVAAARPEQAEPLVDAVVERLRSLGAVVATGRFRAEMQVALVNDGPFTILLEVAP
ncbi:MAG: D-aminoacyl-tRNA deacylase [Acidimicrobiales bacterium]